MINDRTSYRRQMDSLRVPGKKKRKTLARMLSENRRLRRAKARPERGVKA